tara:strand:- start:110 stop:1075 length:966 start_codon:yes stop_codon:yes gene_type:complete
MNYKPIIIVAGEPNSIFLEIFFKTIRKLKIKNPLILIASLKLIKLQMKKLKINKKINEINYENLFKNKLKANYLNVLNINYNTKVAFGNNSSKSNKYVESCFNQAFKILKTKKINKLINGPIVKKTFLKKKYLGITEYVSEKFNINESAMLIYNKNLSVCPLTTHLPLKNVTKNINKKNIIKKVKLIDNFYKTMFRKRPKIAVLGLNPHCESVDKFNEDEKILKPTVKFLNKRKYNVSGPFPADTIFLKKNRKKFDVILGMYHDQVLTPIKTLYEYDAINITLGLPFIKISPDHGPNKKMLGKNKSNPLSLMNAISFLEKH